jgi:hypothetical protein
MIDVTFHQACINLFPLTLSGKKMVLPFYPRSDRGLVFVTKPSRKQNLFFTKKIHFFLFFFFLSNLQEEIKTEGDVFNSCHGHGGARKDAGEAGAVGAIQA